MLLLLLACAPESGTYLLETELWSTTCAVGGGPYEEPAPQYEVEVYVEEAGALWLDSVSCMREELAYICADEPIEEPAGSDATLHVTREWTGGWHDASTMFGEVVWQTTCAGEGCAALTVELCDAVWEYAAVSVNDAE